MLTLSPALAEDAEVLYGLNKDLIDRYEDLTAIDYPRVMLWLRRNLTETLPHFRRVMVDGRVAGYFALIPGADCWEIDSLFLLPEFQSRGIGTQILLHCRSATSLPLRLYVFQKNTRAVQLYKRMGFSVTQEVGTTRYLMEWKIPGC